MRLTSDEFKILLELALKASAPVASMVKLLPTLQKAHQIAALNVDVVADVPKSTDG